MRNKVFILTEDLQFFYKINQKLNELKIKSKILNFWNNLPNIPSVILTTSKEVSRIKIRDLKSSKLLPYSTDYDMEGYLIRVLAAYKIGYKEDYSELVFSVDPGTIHFGLVVFLDDYFLKSHTFNNKNVLLNQIRKYTSFLQKTNKNLIAIRLKFGSGVLSTSIDLIRNIFEIFKDRERLSIFIVDEKRSSKINIYNNKKRFPKHEASALILALRNGIKVEKSNFLKVLQQSKLIIPLKEANSSESDGNANKITIQEIGQKVLSGELTLSESLQLSRDLH